MVWSYCFYFEGIDLTADDGEARLFVVPWLKLPGPWPDMWGEPMSTPTPLAAVGEELEGCTWLCVSGVDWCCI